MAEPLVWLTLAHYGCIDDQGMGWEADLCGFPERVNRLIALFINDEACYKWNAMVGLGYLYLWHCPDGLVVTPDQPEPRRVVPRRSHHFYVVLVALSE